MYEIKMTRAFLDWYNDLDDGKTRSLIAKHVDRMEDGNFGITRHIQDDVYEKKIHYAGGYRLYYFIKSRSTLTLLCAGTKRTQKRDIKKALSIRKDI